MLVASSLEKRSDLSCEKARGALQESINIDTTRVSRFFTGREFIKHLKEDNTY